MRLPFPILAFSLLIVLPAQAQFAYNGAAVHHTMAVSPPAKAREAAPKGPAFKLVHGVIQNEQGALPGATVWLQGSRTIAVTNEEGEFELRVPADAKVVKLVCGYGGLQEEELSLAPVQSMGSVYLLRTKSTSTQQATDK